MRNSIPFNGYFDLTFVFFFFKFNTKLVLDHKYCPEICKIHVFCCSFVFDLREKAINFSEFYKCF